MTDFHILIALVLSSLVMPPWWASERTPLCAWRTDGTHSDLSYGAAG